MRRRREGQGLSELGEEQILELFRKRFPSPAVGVPVGIGDDCALIEIGGGRILVTADHMAEGVHFTRAGTPPDALGYKLAAMNVSDIGAMGGVPSFALLSLALPKGTELGYLDRFSRGLGRACRKYRFHLIGGDTTASRGGIFASLTLLGTLAGKSPLLRSGASPGDVLYVTGHLGASAAGLAALDQGRAAEAPAVRSAVRRHLWPSPPLAFAAAVARRGLATAALDLSDGLSTDLARLCRESGTGSAVDADRLPVLPSTRKAAAILGLDALEAALHGGEEYELLFTARPAAAGRVESLARRRGVAVTAIGTVLKRGGVRLEKQGAPTVPLRPGGWQHF